MSPQRRRFCRLCIDWTERRPHIAGAVGAALTKRCFDLGWTERMKSSGAVMVTASGERGFLETFGIGVTPDSDARGGGRELDYADSSREEQRDAVPRERPRPQPRQPVSYTHLTLPTN